jgi:hypothetical protein
MKRGPDQGKEADFKANWQYWSCVNKQLSKKNPADCDWFMYCDTNTLLFAFRALFGKQTNALTI